MYLDNRGGQAFVVALGVDLEGKKLGLLGRSNGEPRDLRTELLEGLERRLSKPSGLPMVAEGSSRRSRTGTARLIHQRCTLHKDRNIQRHRPNASSRLPWSFRTATRTRRRCCRAMASRHQRVGGRLTRRVTRGGTVAVKVSLLPRACTRRILSRACSPWFAALRVKRYRSSKMRQRWLAAVLLRGSNESRGTHPSVAARCDPSSGRRSLRPQGRRSVSMNQQVDTVGVITSSLDFAGAGVEDIHAFHLHA